MANIQLDRADFFETDIVPTEGDIVFVGARRELVVADVPQNAEHGHLIRTAYRVIGQGTTEATYSVDRRERKNHTLTQLGSAQGPNIKESYDKRLSEAGL